MPVKPVRSQSLHRSPQNRWIFTLFVIICLNLALLPTPVGQLHAQAAGRAEPACENQLFFPVIANGADTASSTEIQANPEEAFAAKVEDGTSGVVRGVYVQDVMALNVVQQPENNPGYVSIRPETATQFDMAESYGVIGLLAHNTLSGSTFYRLAPGDQVAVIYGDGTLVHYQVSEIDQFQALQPYSLTSTFVDLQNGKTLSADQLFEQVYTGGDQVTFQTCISKDGISTWGRYFVIARPISA